MDLQIGATYGRIQTRKTDLYQRTTQKKEGNFAEALNSAQGKKQDNITIKAQTVSQKLQVLKEEGEKMDYSGMTDTEIYGSICGRYEKAFPDSSASMFYYDNENYSKIEEQSILELNNALGKGWGDNIEQMFIDTNGYSGMTKDEIKTAILEKYPSSNPLQKINALQEMRSAGIISPTIKMRLSENIWRNLEKQACVNKGLNWETDKCYENPMRKQWALEYSKGVQLSWGKIIEDFKKNDVLTEDQINESLEEIESVFNDVLEKELRGRL